MRSSSSDTAGAGPAVVLQADVGDDAVDPCGQPRFAAKIGKAAVDPQEHVLRQIFRPRSILHRARDQGEHQILVPVDQLLKRALIAATAALDELALVAGLHRTPY